MGILNRTLGVALKVIFLSPLVLVAAGVSLLRVFDHIFTLEIKKTVIEIVKLPVVFFGTLIAGLIVVTYSGWTSGAKDILRTAPERVWNFFKNELWFGLKKNESLQPFIDALDLSIVNNLYSGLFGKLIIKLFTLLFPANVLIQLMAPAINFENPTNPHNEINIHFTAKNLNKLQRKYSSRLNAKLILKNIEVYLKDKHGSSVQKYNEVKKMSKSTGAIQTWKDNLDQVQASLRCHQRIKNETEITADIPVSTISALCYVWLAIEHESKDAASKEQLRTKLIMAMYQIQCGYNVSLGLPEGSLDMPECGTGALGLLIRVITDEDELMPGSNYRASDPNPANLSSNLKSFLDAPFKSSDHQVKESLRKTYRQNPEAYKTSQKTTIKNRWCDLYSDLIVPVYNESQPLLNEQVLLSEESLDAIIDAGLESWTPPASPVPRRLSAPFI
jgi:hypothetical protein